MSKVKNNWEWLYRILAFGLYDTLTSAPGATVIAENKEHFVAAGNPGKLGIAPASGPFDNGKENRVSKSSEEENFYTVSGNSMSPDGIKNRYILLTKPIKDITDIKEGNLIVIKVDEDFYRMRHHGKVPIFEYKLRRAIMPVPDGADLHRLISDLVGTFAEVFSRSESKDLKESLEEAKDFYGPGEKLYLSATYHDGKIHYSFHPSKNIKEVVAAVLNESRENVSLTDSDMLAS